MQNEFETEEMKSVFSNILHRLQEETEEQISIPSHSEPKRKEIESSTTTSAGFASETPKKSIKTVKEKDFASTTLARMQAMENKKVEKIKRKVELIKEKELSSLQSKPEINELSKKIGKRDKNIMERSEKQLINSKRRLEEKKKKLDDEKEAQICSELTFKPNINSKHGPRRTTEEFFEFNQKWMQRRSQRNEDKRNELEEKEIAEMRPTPEIDKNSEMLVDQMGYNKPVEVRLLERNEKIKQKINNKRIELMPSFAPTLGERSRRLARKKSKENVFKRLFSLSIDESKESPKFGRVKHSKSVINHSVVRDKSLDLTFSA